MTLFFPLGADAEQKLAGRFKSRMGPRPVSVGLVANFIGFVRAVSGAVGCVCVAAVHGPGAHATMPTGRGPMLRRATACYGGLASPPSASHKSILLFCVLTQRLSLKLLAVSH